MARPSFPTSPRHVEQQVRAVERWSQAFAGQCFPKGEVGQAQQHWHLPINQRLVDPSTTPPTVLIRCAQALVDAAAHLATARPPEQDHVRVAALITLPGMLGSQVCIFFEPEYFAGFADRTHLSQTWTALPPERSLSCEWGLTVAPGFEEQGFREVVREPAEHDAGTFEVTHEGEIWVIADTNPKLGRIFDSEIR